MKYSNLSTFRATIEALEAQGFVCAAWNVKGTGDVNIVYGDSLNIDWIVAMASSSATLIY